jgi:hypothetical protein
MCCSRGQMVNSMDDRLAMAILGWLPFRTGMASRAPHLLSIPIDREAADAEFFHTLAIVIKPVRSDVGQQEVGCRPRKIVERLS